MYHMTGEDVLSFVHTTRDSPPSGGDPVAVSQIAVNGVLLDRRLQAVDLDKDSTPPGALDLMSTPLVLEGIPLGSRVAFLNALCGNE